MSGRDIAALLLVTATRLTTGMRANWRGCTPEPRRRIYFANHTSHLDTAVIWAALPPTIRAITHPVAARDYWERSAMRRYIAREVLHAILIDRKGTVAPNVATEQMGEVLERGESIILFPEGTRGDGSELAPFKSGLFYLASRCPTAEMVPVYLENLSRILPKGEVLPVPLLGSVSFGTPMLLEPGEEKAAFLTRARANLLALGESK